MSFLSTMRITKLQWHPYCLPLRKSFVTAHGTMAIRKGIIVEVFTDGGISGLGEIAPLPEFGGGCVNDALTLLPMLAAQLLGNTLDEALDMLRIDSIASEVNTPSAPTLCGLEMALLDVLGKTRQCSVSTLLSPIGTKPRPGVPVNAVVGARSVEAAVADAQEAVAAGFNCLKLKVGSEIEVQAEIDRIAVVRQAIGSHVHLRLDANEAWSLEQAIAILSHCAQFDIQYVEQPLTASDLAGMSLLRQTVPIPIAADEALSNIESARRILDNKSADILIIKLQLVGGLRAAQQIIQEATERGVQSIITSSIESGAGVVAALHLVAASPSITLECGLATLHLLADDLLLDELAPHNGFLAVPAGFGLGIQSDREALDRYSS